MDFNPDTWGTVGQWASAGLTGLAFLTTAFVVARDTTVRKQSQARKVAYYFREVDRAPDEVRGRYTKWWDHEIHNLSDEPIYRVQLHELDEYRTPSPMFLRFREVLLPGETFVIREPRYPSKNRRVVQFRDNSGRPWIRTLRGKLKEVRWILNWGRDTYSYQSRRKAFNVNIERIMSEFRDRERS